MDQEKYRDMEKMTVISDGGRHKSAWAKKETRDCTVRALAHTFGVTYTEAHKACAKAGRPLRRGFWVQRALDSGAFNHLGKVTRYKGYEGRQLLTVVEMLKRAKLPVYITVTGHATALRDGKVLDCFVNRPGRRVDGVWTVEPAPDRPGAVAEVISNPQVLQDRPVRNPFCRKSVTPEEAAKIRFDYVFNFDPKNK